MIPEKYKQDKLLWLTEQRQDLIEKHRGQWVVIDIEHNKVFADTDLNIAVNQFKMEHPSSVPSVFRIPLKEEELYCYGIFL